MSQAAGTLPICSIYAPRVSLAVHPAIPRMLILLISAHDYHLAPPTDSWWPNATVSFL